MRSTAAVVFGNAMTSRIDDSPGQQRADAIEPERQAAVRRRAVFERLEKEPESVARFLVGHAEQAEDLGLRLAVVDTDAAAAQLPAVEDDVVGLGQHAPRVRLEQRASPLRAAR